MLAIANELGVKTFPVGLARRALRLALGTWTAQDSNLNVAARFMDQYGDEARNSGDAVSASFRDIGEDLAASGDESLLLGFPTAPFVIVLRPDRPGAFEEYVSRHGPNIQVDIRFTNRRDVTEDWGIVPADNSGEFELRFTLPKLLADWILSADGAATHRARDVRAALLSTISIIQNGRLVQLHFEPARRDHV